MKSSTLDAATPDLLSQRLARRESTQRVPKPLADEPGLFVVDATWGTIAPIELAPGVQTVGELEVIEHIERGQPVIDTRSPEAFVAATIPGARNLPWRETEVWLHEFTHEPCVLFCNGPQCAATPTVVAILLKHGRPAGSLLYYRGGMHDWITLGLPVEAGVSD